LVEGSEWWKTRELRIRAEKNQDRKKDQRQTEMKAGGQGTMDKAKRENRSLKTGGRETAGDSGNSQGQNTQCLAWEPRFREDPVGLQKGQFQNVFLLVIDLTANGDLFLIAVRVPTIDQVSSHCDYCRQSSKNTRYSTLEIIIVVPS
jgi:hypothetical protein